MPISIQCTINQVESCISGSPDVLPLANLSSTHKNIEDGDVISVLTIDDLPSAELNTGRMIFVESVGEYRYSDGVSWTNNYDSSYTVITSELYSWGRNLCGQLGNLSVVDASLQVQEATSSIDWCAVTAATNSTAALKSDGTMWRWGISFIAGGANQSSPVQEPLSSTEWCAVKLGGGGVSHGILLKTNNTLWSWGYNNVGQLGLNNITSSYCVPVQEITSTTNWCNVAAGENHSIAIKTNGTLWGMGEGSRGQLAQISNINYSSPVQELTSNTNWCGVGAGDDFSSAIKTDGTLWAWGNNLSSQLGDGTSICRSSPVQEVTSSTNWSFLTDSGGTTRTNGGIKTDGTLWMWGRNAEGQLATNAFTFDANSPIQEFSLSTNWRKIDNSDRITSALKTDGTLWMWGSYLNGALQNQTTNVSSPIQEITSSNGWFDVSVGYRAIFGINQNTKGFL